jgi:hypothetical protein
LINLRQTQCYVTTDGQSASLSWCQGPPPRLGPKIRYLLMSVAGLLMWGTLSDDRTVCSLKLLLALVSTIILGFESRGTHDHILLSQIRRSPNMEGHIHIFISPMIAVVQLCPPPHRVNLSGDISIIYKDSVRTSQETASP